MPGSPRKDYLEQQIEGVAKLLAHVLGLRDAGRTDEARTELERGARSLLGVGMGPLGRVDVATAVGLLRSKGGAEAYALLLEGEASLTGDEALQERARRVRALASSGDASS